jgi:mannosyltransferase
VVRARVSIPPALLAAIGLLMAGSLVLRMSGLESGYWIDEGIAVGIASHDFSDIPSTLVMDGSPPLYYLLLHAWMGIVGEGEAATRALSLIFAVVAVPVAYWAGNTIFDRRTGVLAAVGVGACPFLNYYAQETRMYSLVVVLSLLASASFVLAFLHGRRGHLIALGAWMTLLFYTHAWGIYLAIAMACAWLVLWRRGRVAGRDGLLVAGAVLLLYAPWIPTLITQAQQTAAPWSDRPTAMYLLWIPFTIFGEDHRWLATPLLMLAVLAALRRVRDHDGAIRVLAGLALGAALAAWIGSQIEPAWANRYFSVFLGPLMLALAAILARGRLLTAAALAGVVAIWLFNAPIAERSNVRTVAAEVTPVIRPGDVVASTQPEQVPVLSRYLPSGVLYVTPLGMVFDERVTDWRNGLDRMRAGKPGRDLLPLLERLGPGRRILLVTPIPNRPLSKAPWKRAIRARTREWRRAMERDPRLREIEAKPREPLKHLRSTVRAEVFEVK